MCAAPKLSEAFREAKQRSPLSNLVIYFFSHLINGNAAVTNDLQALSHASWRERCWNSQIFQIVLPLQLPGVSGGTAGAEGAKKRSLNKPWCSGVALSPSCPFFEPVNGWRLAFGLRLFPISPTVLMTGERGTVNFQNGGSLPRVFSGSLIRENCSVFPPLWRAEPQGSWSLVLQC